MACSSGEYTSTVETLVHVFHSVNTLSRVGRSSNAQNISRRSTIQILLFWKVWASCHTSLFSPKYQQLPGVIVQNTKIQWYQPTGLRVYMGVVLIHGSIMIYSLCMTSVTTKINVYKNIGFYAKPNAYMAGLLVHLSVKDAVPASWVGVELLPHGSFYLPLCKKFLAPLLSKWNSSLDCEILKTHSISRWFCYSRKCDGFLKT